MQTSLIYHAFGVKNVECTAIAYKDSSIILNIQTKEEKLCCPCCGSRKIVRNGYKERQFKAIPIGRKPVCLNMKVQRVKCKNCNHDGLEKLHFVTGKKTTTHRFERFVIELLRMGTISDVAKYLRVGWTLVKEIHKNYLKNNFSNPDISKVRYIGIDEFAVSKGHVYKTIVVDLETGHIIYVGEGKGSDSLDKFWKKIEKKDVTIEYVSSDLSQAYISAIRKHIPKAIHVFDRFHVKKLVVDKLDSIRKSLYHDEKFKENRDVIKGMRWLILGNGEDISLNGQEKLQKALEINEPLSKAYYLKEELDEVWKQPIKSMAREVLYSWISKALRCGVEKMVKVAVTIFKRREGILAWYNKGISNGKVEGINNKIKVMKRDAYGFRDDKYFDLRLLALHASGITAFAR